MDRNEFFQKISSYGISLKDIGIFVDEHVRFEYALGLYANKGNTVIYAIKERGEEHVKEYANESDAFEELYREVLFGLKRHGYMSASISKDIICTEKSIVEECLCGKYGICMADAKAVWDYLCTDMRVLNELKYFVVKENFVPEQEAVSVHGYTAERLYRETGLNEIEAMKCMLMIRSNKWKSSLELQGALKEYVNVRKKGLHACQDRIKQLHGDISKEQKPIENGWEAILKILKENSTKEPTKEYVSIRNAIRIFLECSSDTDNKYFTRLCEIQNELDRWNGMSY
jgi:hypothetical protein